MLSAAVPGVKELLLAEPPDLMVMWFKLITILLRRRRPRLEFIPHILGQFSDMAAIVLPAKHPIGQVNRRLISLDIAQYTNIISQAWRVAVDCFESTLDPLSNAAWDFHIQYIQTESCLYKEESSLRGLLRKGNVVQGALNNTRLKLLVYLALNLMSQERFAEAIETARDCITRSSSSGSEHSVFFYCRGLWLMGNAQSALGNIGLAEESF